MKWLFALLLVANVALFMWGSWYRAPLVDPRPERPARQVAAEKLKLLSEPGVRLLLRQRDQPPAPPPQPVATGRCYRLGPFASADAAEAAGRRLAAWGVSHERVAEIGTAPAAYHVFLPPFPTRQAAERKRRELSRRGFSDHALMVEEGMENGISLGVFGVQANAEARIAELERAGVQASMRPLAGTRAVYWLSLASVADESGGAMERLRAADWGSDAKLQPTSCPP